MYKSLMKMDPSRRRRKETDKIIGDWSCPRPQAEPANESNEMLKLIAAQSGRLGDLDTSSLAELSIL